MSVILILESSNSTIEDAFLLHSVPWQIKIVEKQSIG